MTRHLPKPGARVDLGDKSGVVLCVVDDRVWGRAAFVLMDAGHVRPCYGLQEGPGAGWRLRARA